jgi:hypothetical protein
MLARGESSMRRLLPILLLLAACRSSAPYTLPAAFLNTGIAVGASAGRRAAGDCFTPCTYGTVCNPRTGYCEAASTRDVCAQTATGDMQCVPMPPPTTVERKPAATQEGGLVPSLGVSPETGKAPPPPDQASPARP